MGPPSSPECQKMGGPIRSALVRGLNDPWIERMHALPHLDNRRQPC